MNEQEKNNIRKQIESLPKGSITIKKIRDKEYEYWQYWENGKHITRRVKGEELETLRAGIRERKRLEQLLREADIPDLQETSGMPEPIPEYCSLVRIGDDLLRFAAQAAGYRHRELYRPLHDFVFGPAGDRVMILYGLRRTGKTTMLRQLVLDMPADMQKKTVFIQAVPKETLADLNRDLKDLESRGYRYVFIDEVTLLEDFIEGAALFSDIFASSGMKIVLSGTDSLGFLFAEDEQLFDRCIMLHTTFIPYREFDRVLGIKGIDEYIRYGGTMSLGGRDYNSLDTPFASRKRTNEYVDSAIAGNIQHSLKNYRYGGHFRALYDLYEKGELTGAINRVVEDMNHRFTLDVLTRAFRSQDLGMAKANLRRDRKNPTDVLDRIDTDEVTEILKNLLEIRNKEEQTIVLTEEHVREIREYLAMLDLISDIDVDYANGGKGSRTVFTQPGLRYAQADALITSLMQDETFRDLGIRERTRITERIRDEIRGRMMEDIVLLETKLAEPEKRVCTLQFPIGEFDMVVSDPADLSCRIYEVKNSAEIVSQQYRHLADPEKCAETEKQYGDIAGKYVIYGGQDAEYDGIQYRNVEEYLCSLGE